MSSTVTEIIGKQSVSDAAEKARKGLHGLSDESTSTSKITDILTNKTKLLQGVFDGFVVTAVVAGLKKATEAAFDCYQEFGEMDRRMQQLKISLDNNEDSYNRNVELIETLSKKSLASKDDIESLVAELASLGKSDEDIKKIATAAVYLSNVTGQDLNAAFNQINGTYSGTAGRLEKLIPETGDLTKKQLEAGDAVDLVNQKLGSLSETLAENNIPQKLKNLKTEWGDLKENAGETVAPFFSAIVDGLNAVIQGWNNARKAAVLYNELKSDKLSAAHQYEANNELIEIKKKQLADAKVSRDTIVGADMTGMLQMGNTALDDKVAKLEKDIQNLIDANNKLLAKNPGLATMQDVPRVTYNGGQNLPGASGSGGDSELTKTLKANYKTVEGIEKDLEQFIGINENHPGYYSNDQIQSFIASIRGRVYGAETLQLGPEATSLLNDVRTLLQVVESLQKTATYGTSASDKARSYGGQIIAYAKAAAASQGSASDRARSYGEATIAMAKVGLHSASDLARNYGGQIIAYAKAAAASQGSASDRARSYGEFQVALIEAAKEAAPAIRQAMQNPSATDFLGNAVNQSTRPASKFDWLFTKIDTLGTKLIDFGLDAQSTAGFTGLLGKVALKAGNTVELFNTHLKSTITTLKGSFKDALASQKNTSLGNLNTAVASIISSLGPFGDMLAGMDPILASLILVIEGFSNVIAPLVSTELAPFIGIFRTIGTYLGSVFAPILSALSPIIVALATGFAWLYNNILLPVGNAIIKAGNWFYNAIVTIINKLRFWSSNKLSTIDLDSGTLEKIDVSDLASAGATNYSTSTTSSSTASYTQTRDINVYVTINTAALVGSDGIDEFALMIGHKLKASGVLGVS